MKKLIVFILVISTLFACVACQPTPDKPPVVSKNDGQLEKEIYEGADEGYIYQPPENATFEASAFNGRLIVNADGCPVSARAGIKYPVYQAKAKNFDRDLVLTIYKYCFGDAKITFHITQETKSEIEAHIVEIKKRIFEIEQGDYDPADYMIGEIGNDGSIITEEDVLSNLRYVLDVREKEKNTAPETIERTPIDLSEYRVGDILNGDVYQKDGRQGRFYVNRDVLCVNFDYDAKDTSKNFIETDSDWEETAAVMPIYNLLGDDEYTAFTKERGYTEPNFSVDAAKKAASDFVKGLGLDDTYYLSDIGQSTHYMPNCYAVCFMRKVGDSGLVSDDTASRFGEANGYDRSLGEQYTRPFLYEQLVLWVGRHGVRSFFYHAPLEITRTLSASVEINDDFDKISKGITNYLRDEFSTGVSDEDGNDLTYEEAQKAMSESGFYQTYSVRSIELHYAQIREKNNDGYYLLVPAWFIGYRHTTNEPDFGESLTYRSFAVNAIDGTVIDRTNMGY